MGHIGQEGYQGEWRESWSRSLGCRSWLGCCNACCLIATDVWERHLVK